MNFVETIKNQPAKAFFYLATVAALIFIYLFRAEFQLNKMNSKAEQTVHNLKAAFLMLAIFALLAAAVYFLLSRFRRRTSPILNLTHFALLLALLAVLCYQFLTPKPSPKELLEMLSRQQPPLLETASNWLFIGSFVVLIFNVLMALFSSKSEVLSN